MLISALGGRERENRGKAVFDGTMIECANVIKDINLLIQEVIQNLKIFSKSKFKKLHIIIW